MDVASRQHQSSRLTISGLDDMEALMTALLVALALVLAAGLWRFLAGRQAADSEAGAPSAGFDVYVINLDRARQRMETFMRGFLQTDLKHLAPIRVAAIDGRSLELDGIVTPEALAEIKRAEAVGYRERHYELTRGAVGCALSHRAVWDRLLASDKEMAMVCEDDARLEDTTLEEVRAASPPPDWDVLLLGYWCVKCSSHSTHKEMQRFFGLHCYLIKRQAVGKIRAYAGGRVAQQEDSMLSDMCEEGRLKVYGVPRKLAVQSGSGSSVQIPLKPRAEGQEGPDPWLPLPVVLASLHMRQG